MSFRLIDVSLVGLNPEYVFACLSGVPSELCHKRFNLQSLSPRSMEGLLWFCEDY